MFVPVLSLNSLINACPSPQKRSLALKIDAPTMIGVIDARVAGVSGDKYLGALLDLGGSQGKLTKVGKTIENCLPGTRKIEIRVESVERGEIAAKLVRVQSKEDVEKRKGGVVRTAIQECSNRLGLSHWARGFALSTVETLLNAESHVHGNSPRDVELHELGSADIFVDVLGVASLADELGVGGLEWWSTVLSVGGGTSHFSGRDYPNPPPAVAEILRAYQFPLRAGRSSRELSTPTGAAITVNLAGKVLDSYPAILVDKIGYGAGSDDLPDVANILRLMTGRSQEASHDHDEVVVLETNVDDVSGEVIGHAVEELMDAGARDVSITPVFMKKNRPGHIISVIANRTDAERLADLLIEQTGTFGVREMPVTRHISRREVNTVKITVNGKSYPLRAKSARDRSGRTIRTKLEYEDLKKTSKKTGVSMRELSQLNTPSEVRKKH